MPLATRRIRPGLASADYWPGFVDAMATLLLVITFLLSIFMVSQFFLSQELSGRDEALRNLQDDLSELTSLLALERKNNQELYITLDEVSASLAAVEEERAQLSNTLSVTAAELSEEQTLSAEARDEVALLNRQLAALREQMAVLATALEASEERDKQAQAQIAALGKRLNAALAQKVQQLARYRSEFFGRLREVLGNRPDIEIVGDRFIFQSEILFESASAEINPAGRQELAKLARALLEVGATIPKDIDWVLRVDGHSDALPIRTEEFPTNWHLSSARAIAVVRYLIAKRVSARRLVAAGFGAHHPLAKGGSPQALKRNRRIELKLTER